MKIWPGPEDNLEEIFWNELENHDGKKLSKISNELNIPKLDFIDKMYGIANDLSIENQGKYRTILKGLAIFGALLVLIFLIYDSTQFYMVISGCIVVIACLGGFRYWADKSHCHKRYLEFRVLAESLRLQYFLSVAGVETKVVDILPWFIKTGIPWISNVLHQVKHEKLNDDETEHILNFWIRNQISYHDYNIRKTEKEKRISEKTTNIIRWATILFYILVFLLEMQFYFHYSAGMDDEVLRTVMKVALGFMSGVTIFVDSYYGKKSLEDLIDDSTRMKELYIEIEQKVMHEGESEEVLVDLAREYLIENSIWYAYQNQNKPDLVM